MLLSSAGFASSEGDRRLRVASNVFSLSDQTVKTYKGEESGYLTMSGSSSIEFLITPIICARANSLEGEELGNIPRVMTRVLFLKVYGEPKEQRTVFLNR